MQRKSVCVLLCLMLPLAACERAPDANDADGRSDAGSLAAGAVDTDASTRTGGGGTSGAAHSGGRSSAAGKTAGSAAGGDGSTPASGADFATRCDAAGVLVCRGFDSATELESSNGSGAEPDDRGSMNHLTIDGTIKTSGAGSLRFEIAGKTSSNHSGAFRQPMGKAFGPGSSFYAQLRVRLSASFVDTDWDTVVGSYPKIVLFHHSSATCNDIEWAQVMNGWYDNIATMYTHCGQAQPGQSRGGMFFQEGDFTCPYGADYARDPGCFKYPAEVWLTFYYKATIGQWGRNDSRLEAWVAMPGEGYKKWIDDPRYTLQAEGASVAGFDSVYLTTYMTSKDESADHATAYAWYDELIVSTMPIAPPK